MKINDILLFESFPLAKKEFSQEADPAEVEKYISKYREYLKQSFISNEYEKDINYWRKLGYDDFKEFMDYTDERAKKSNVMKRMTKDFIVVEDNQAYRIASPCSYAASKKLGVHSTWCTSSSNPVYFRKYFYDDNNILAFFLPKSDFKDNFCIRYDVSRSEIKEVKDLTQEMSYAEACDYLVENFGISPEEIIEKVLLKFDIIEKVREKNREHDKPYDRDLYDILDRIRKRGYSKNDLPDGNLMDDLDYVSGYFFSDFTNEITDAIRILQAAFRYNEYELINYIMERIVKSIDVDDIDKDIPEHIKTPQHEFLRSIILYAKKLYSLEVSTKYATLMLENRWEELENRLIKAGDPALIYEYYRKFFKDKGWKEAEHILAKSPFFSSIYAISRGQRWYDAEKTILSDPAESFRYAREFFDGVGWPEAEPTILTDDTWTRHYAQYVLGKRWPEGEKAILKAMDPDNVILYAKNVIGGRWREAEPLILQHKQCAEIYMEIFGLMITNGKFFRKMPKKVGDGKYTRDY